MKVFVAFLLLSIISTATCADDDRFCTEVCPYFKNMDKDDPSKKIDSKKVLEKCKTDPKAPKIYCKKFIKDIASKKLQKWFPKMMESSTWKDLCHDNCDRRWIEA